MPDIIREPDPALITEQAKSIARIGIYAALFPIIGRYVAPDTIDALASSTATVAVSVLGVLGAGAWSLINKWLLVTQVVETKEVAVRAKQQLASLTSHGGPRVA